MSVVDRGPELWSIFTMLQSTGSTMQNLKSLSVRDKGDKADPRNRSFINGNIFTFLKQTGLTRPV